MGWDGDQETDLRSIRRDEKERKRTNVGDVEER